ncbi:MAG: hypothetical protein GY700_02115, partial [Propionibacteriaceae bacterium]|nr:hypothetical protein [Propionibacteriaceae bacterium]
TEEFQVPVTEDGEITVSTSGQIVPTIEVYDPSGQLVASDASGTLTCIASSLGVYTAKTTAETDQWLSYDVSILSEVPASVEPLVAHDGELVYALPPDQATLLPVEATRDGYLTILGHEHTPSSGFAVTLIDQQGNSIAQATPVEVNGSNLWPHQWRSDYQATAGHSYQVLVSGSDGQVN